MRDERSEWVDGREIGVNKWQPQLVRNYKHIYLGYYKELHEAAAIYAVANAILE
jgi:hypothetical protein